MSTGSSFPNESVHIHFFNKAAKHAEKIFGPFMRLQHSFLTVSELILEVHINRTPRQQQDSVVC